MTNSEIFNLHKTTGKARAGELITSHGKVQTPVFAPVGSQGSVKTLTPDDLKEIGFDFILANTYHLYLRPGIETLEKMGGLHKFMGWDRAILTDSGGFQVFSLSRIRKVDDDGVTFRSHIDGSEHRITPESAIRFQESIGADIIMVLDECPAHDDSPENIEKAMDRTHRWAEICLNTRQRQDQSLFAIVQGGMSPELRSRSADYLASLDFPGYAIGGLSIGETKQEMLDMVAVTAPRLPENKPRYLMGVGSPEDILECVDLGIDMFDCVLPTRVARNGALYTRQGRINIRNARYATENNPLEADCECYTCRTFTPAYLRHLFIARELLAYRLATIHNLEFMRRLMTDIRVSILNDGFNNFKSDFLSRYRPADEQTRLEQKQKWLKRQR